MGAAFLLLAVAGDAGVYGSSGNVRSDHAVLGMAAGSAPPAPATGTTALPAVPPVTWCETGLPISPHVSPPAGAVVVPAGDNSTGISQNWNVSPNTTYWFAPGTHTFGTGIYGVIEPKDGDTFIGAPGAILDGQGVNGSAFTGYARGVTLKYLTIQSFNTPTDQIVVNHDGGAGWRVEYDLLRHNKGGAVTAGDNGTITNNCLAHNGQYGLQGWGDRIAITNNDIADNNADGYYDLPGSKVSCGCAGGSKFWGASNAVVTGNYVHDNKGVGLWADTNNAGFLISGNYIANNWSEGIMYEISYNAQITNNTLIRNAIGMGSTQRTPGFPDGAIYISESGGDSRVASDHAGQLLISGNVLTDNWGGVVVWENADRYCSDGADGVCTLVDPSTYTMSSCGANLSKTAPVDYYNNCRWKSQNVLVDKNVFTMRPSGIAKNCNVATMCGYNGLFSNYGTSTYGATRTVNVTFRQSNWFTNNMYSGPWRFFAWSQSNLSNPVDWSDWTAPVTDQCADTSELSSGTCDSGFGQDAGSTLSH